MRFAISGRSVMQLSDGGIGGVLLTFIGLVGALICSWLYLVSGNPGLAILGALCVVGTAVGVVLFSVGREYRHEIVAEAIEEEDV